MSNFLTLANILTIMTIGILNVALAQSIPTPAQNKVQPNLSTNGPPGTYSRTQTNQTIDSAGTVRTTSQKFNKSQIYTNTNNQLSARTKIKSTGPATTITQQGNDSK